MTLDVRNAAGTSLPASAVKLGGGVAPRPPVLIDPATGLPYPDQIPRVAPIINDGQIFP
ncbi:MAG TPA: hypothetical protein VI457_01455 [Methylococcaceae bacterium]|nr:hypothetical protein [Methylococcaceae bacterium]